MKERNISIIYATISVIVTVTKMIVSFNINNIINVRFNIIATESFARAYTLF